MAHPPFLYRDVFFKQDRCTSLRLKLLSVPPCVRTFFRLREAIWASQHPSIVPGRFPSPFFQPLFSGLEKWRVCSFSLPLAKLPGDDFERYGGLLVDFFLLVETKAGLSACLIGFSYWLFLCSPSHSGVFTRRRRCSLFLSWVFPVLLLPLEPRADSPLAS